MNAVFGLRGGAWTLVRVSAVLWVRLVKNVEVVEAGIALHERTDLGDARMSGVTLGVAHRVFVGVEAEDCRVRPWTVSIAHHDHRGRLWYTAGNRHAVRGPDHCVDVVRLVFDDLDVFGHGSSSGECWVPSFVDGVLEVNR